MSKTILSFLSVTFTCVLFSQVELFFAEDTETLINGEEILITGSPSDIQVKAYLEIKNISGAPGEFKVERHRLKYGTSNDLLCIGDICLEQNDPGDPDVYEFGMAVSLGDGEKTKLEPGVAPENESFCAIHKYYIKDGKGEVVDSLQLRVAVGVSEGSCVLSTTEKILMPKNTTLYPNPSSGLVNIKNPTENGEIQVFDVLGKNVVSKRITLNTKSIDLSLLKEGVYFYSVVNSDGKKSTTHKLVIKR